MYKPFTSQSKPQVLRLEKRKVELGSTFFLPEFIRITLNYHYDVIDKLVISSWMNITEAWVRICTY